MSGYVKAERIWLKTHPDYSEKWVQAIIAEDPAILGLGDLELRGQERIQPRAGRLDLLLQDPESNRRYEVELQLGATDETHIIRAIEYWDIERRRYPQYDHCAVLVAEDVTSRFLNVISLFNGAMPFIALQMQALRVSGATTLVFTKVMDELTRGLVDEDEEQIAVPADRAYWEKRVGPAVVAIADSLLGVAQAVEPGLTLKFNKQYIGMARNGQAFNFVVLRPRKSGVILSPKIPDNEETTRSISDAGLDQLPYDKAWGRYRIMLRMEDVGVKQDFLRDLLGQAYTHHDA